MNKLIVLGAAALTLLAMLPEEAFAQRGRVGGVGFRGVGGGYRAVAIGGGGYRGYGYRGVGYGYPSVGYSYYGRPLLAAGWGWRGRWPFAAGIAIGGLDYAGGYYASPYYDSCIAWTGYDWANVCY